MNQIIIDTDKVVRRAVSPDLGGDTEWRHPAVPAAEITSANQTDHCLFQARLEYIL